MHTFFNLFSYKYFTKDASSSVGHCLLNGNDSSNSFSAAKKGNLVQSKIFGWTEKRYILLCHIFRHRSLNKCWSYLATLWIWRSCEKQSRWNELKTKIDDVTRGFLINIHDVGKAPLQILLSDWSICLMSSLFAFWSWSIYTKFSCSSYQKQGSPSTIVH